MLYRGDKGGRVKGFLELGSWGVGCRGNFGRSLDILAIASSPPLTFQGPITCKHPFRNFHFIQA